MLPITKMHYVYNEANVLLFSGENQDLIYKQVEDYLSDKFDVALLIKWGELQGETFRPSGSTYRYSEKTLYRVEVYGELVHKPSQSFSYEERFKTMVQAKTYAYNKCLGAFNISAVVYAPTDEMVLFCSAVKKYEGWEAQKVNDNNLRAEALRWKITL